MYGFLLNYKNQIKCPNCHLLIGLDDKVCYHCRYELSEEEFKKLRNIFYKEKKRNFILGGIGGTILFVFLVLIFSLI